MIWTGYSKAPLNVVIILDNTPRPRPNPERPLVHLFANDGFVQRANIEKVYCHSNPNWRDSRMRNLSSTSKKAEHATSSTTLSIKVDGIGYSS